ncbi:NmrA family NAD(P)-binding protein [Streptomyces sp. GSL17-111]|uniref:NmrA family NAD(P)-binding protein n=1 Tax=Streptomyces sp. GSL17-111 TaxID=3121596 RepID=UPI0030F4B0E6
MNTPENTDSAAGHPGGLTLVAGGTGRTGRRVVARLRARGVAVRVGSRRGEPPFDWHDASTWEAALEGVTEVYLAYAPDLGTSEATRVVADFAGAAARAGVRHVVLLSMRGRDAERPTGIAARAAEQAVRECGTTWTVLRAGWFFQNFSELDVFRESLRAGEMTLPTGDGLEAFVDAEDIADVAVAALRDPAAHAGRCYELSGARLLSFWDAVAEIATATGREVREVRQEAREFARTLRGAGLPAPEVDLVCELLDRVRAGEMAYVSDGVREVLGRAPRDFTAYVKACAAEGVWQS